MSQNSSNKMKNASSTTFQSLLVDKPIRFEEYADHYQFVAYHDGETDFPIDLWEDRPFIGLIATGHGFIVQTQRYECVPITLELQTKQPDIKEEEWNFIARGSVNLPTGKLIITDLLSLPAPEEAHRFAFKPGYYQYLIMGKNYHTVQSDWEGDDEYYIIMWPGKHIDAELLWSRDN